MCLKPKAIQSIFIPYFQMYAFCNLILRMYVQKICRSRAEFVLNFIPNEL